MNERVNECEIMSAGDRERVSEWLREKESDEERGMRQYLIVIIVSCKFNPPKNIQIF